MAAAESRTKHRDPPLIIPQELLGRGYKCAGCGRSQDIDWLEKQAHPKESVASTAGDGNWVPLSFSNTCAVCQHRNDILAEKGEFHGALLVSADEAARDVGEVSMFLLAGCGISPDKRQEVEAKIQSLELDLADDSGNRVTTFHAKDIMSQKAWPEAGLSKRLKYVRRMARIVQTNRVSKFVTAGAIRAGDAAAKRNLRDEVFSAYTMRGLERCTESGIRPTFAFDQVQRGKKNGWAEECMMGIQRYPLFVWFSRGAHIGDIEHVEPGSTTESKIADCLAFVSAREFERRLADNPVDVDTRWFGYSQFSGYNGNGDLIHSDGVGFPWRRVFGLRAPR